MRILHLCAGNLYGGIERLLVTLARERAACAEMQPEFAACFEGRLTEELRATGVPVHILGPVRFSRPWMVSRARRELRNLLDQQRYDAVVCHACWPHMLFGSTVVDARQRLVLWSHDVLTGKNWIERLARRVTPELVIAASNFSGASVRTLFPGVSVKILACPVPSFLIDNRETIRCDTRRSFGTKENAVVFVLASRLEPCKGHRLLLEALAQLDQSAAWECWIAGGVQRPKEQHYLDALKSLAKTHRIGDRMKWLGQRSDVPNLLMSGDIYCQPNSGPEAFGIAFIEAMHAGLPVVTTRLGPACEIVNELCGRLIPPSADALAATLSTLMSDRGLRESLGRAGQRRAVELCDPGARLRDLAGLLAASEIEEMAA